MKKIVLLVSSILSFFSAISQSRLPYKQAEILWDTWGVPHIYAKNDESLFYAYGWAQTRNHGDLLLHLYGQARGKGAEYWGESYAEADRWVITNGVYERAEAWLKAQKPPFRANLEAFAKGVNEYVIQNPDQIDPAAKAALPITAVDILAHMQRITHFVFVAPSSRLNSALKGADNGSNAWAVAPRKSASGNTLLLTNPHLPWADFYLYMEVQLVSPNINAYGIARMGFPMLTMAFNGNAGYSQTVNTHDGQDFYELKPVEGGYRFDGQVKTFTTRVHTLKIKQTDGSLKEEKMVVRHSVHGPVVSDKGGKTIAMRVVGLDQPGMFEQYWDMARAKNVTEFQAAVSRLQVPMYTLMFADNSGNIFNLFNGQVPVRSQGDWNYWSGIVRGDTSATLWTKTHPYKDLPKVLNPPTGWLQNTNEPPWTATWPMVNQAADFPPYLAPVPNMSLRTQRSIKMLMGYDKITLDEFIAYKLSTRMELADRLVDDLLLAAKKEGSPEATEAAEVLAAWDHQTETDSKGAFLFDRFVRLWAPGLTDLGTASKRFARPWDHADPVNTPDGLADPGAAVKFLVAAAKEVKQKYGRLDIPWGDVFRFRIGDVDLPGNGGPEPMGVFRSMTLSPAGVDGTFTPVHGDTYVAAIEFSKPLKARVLTSYSNASQPGSKHRTDQLPLLSRKKMRPVWFLRKETEEHLEERTVFK
ncbi:acylase [Larkinella knui]|uniref:Acylase n=1 Tax=Larkinella knui TaxID=2025310 RepID=A0A3P1CYA5_9BACT|nr:acylase [Larkinella knui]RRB18080.1 acylase [Larkinella knui]